MPIPKADYEKTIEVCGAVHTPGGCQNKTRGTRLSNHKRIGWCWYSLHTRYSFMAPDS